MDVDQFRLLNVFATFLIAGTLSWRQFYHRAGRGIDDTLRSAAAIAVYACLAVGSGVAYQRHLPAPFTVVVLTFLLTFYLTALWTPWRWRKPRR